MNKAFYLDDKTTKLVLVPPLSKFYCFKHDLKILALYFGNPGL